MAALGDPSTLSLTTISSPAYLTAQTHWIRNTLDPIIALDGGEALSVNDILTLDALLRALLKATSISATDLQRSRIHLAILEINGRATRWPAKLIERAEALERVWEAKFGSLRDVGWDLFSEGARLEGWKGCEGLGREEVLVRWLKDPGVKLSPVRARKWGDLGFNPGDWWINPLFAFRAGILDSADPKGGIVADSKGTYAVLMTDADEVRSESPEVFTYRARESDKGRYRLTAATIDARQPVRILRNHALRSFWSPRAGVRYEGLYKVTSWSIVRHPSTKGMTYDIAFKRLPSEPRMEAVLARPWAEELDDYRKYKRMRRDARKERAQLASKIDERPDMLSSSDGTIEPRMPGRDSAAHLMDVPDRFGDSTAGSPTGSVIVGGGRGRFVTGHAIVR